MEIVYNHATKSVNLLENNKELHLMEVITRCLEYHEFDDLYQIMGLMTTKFTDYANMIEKLLETNSDVEKENDDLCTDNSEKQRIVEQLLKTNSNLEKENSENKRIAKKFNKKIRSLEEEIMTNSKRYSTTLKEMGKKINEHRKEHNDKEHKLWIQFLQEKKKNEKLQKLVDNLQEEKTRIVEGINKLDSHAKKERAEDSNSLHFQQLTIDNLTEEKTNLEVSNNELESKFLEEKKKNQKIQELVDDLTEYKNKLEEKNNKLWLELVEVQRENRQENRDYDMLSDVSYTS